MSVADAFCAFLRLLALVASLAVGAPLAAQDIGGWKFDPFARIETGIVLSESQDRDDELVINGDGGYLRGQVGAHYANDATDFRLEADRIAVERFGSATGRDRFNRDRLTAAVTQALGDGWEVEAGARVYDDLVSIEAADTDEVQAFAQVQFEPGRAHRFRLRAAWRDRQYDDGAGPGGASSDGNGARVDVDYRHRLGRYHYINFDLRAESIDSPDPERRFRRESASVSYTRPLNRNMRVRPAVELRQTRFGGRLTPGGQVREDTHVVPEVELLWWPGNWRVEAEAKYISADSNDPLRDRRGYRFSVSVGYVF